MNKVKAFIEKGADHFSVYVDLSDTVLNYGIHGNGQTPEQAVADFYGAYDAMKTYHREQGKPFVEAEFEIVYELSAFLSAYSGLLTYSGLEKLTGVNKVQLAQYGRGVRNPSAKTAKKVESALHSLGQELAGISFSHTEGESAQELSAFLSAYSGLLTYSGLEKLTGVNKAQLSHYVQGFRNPSAKTAKKVENALHSLGQEWVGIKLL